MKKMICFDGVDGAGKTTLITAFRVELFRHFIAHEVYGKYHPLTNRVLGGRDGSVSTETTAYAKFSYRLSRSYMMISRVLARNEDVFLSDRGFLNLQTNCVTDNIPKELYTPFLENMRQRLEGVELYTILLQPSFEVTRKRLEQNKEMDGRDKAVAFLQRYYDNCNEIFVSSPYIGNRISIDTDKYSGYGS